MGSGSTVAWRKRDLDFVRATPSRTPPLANRPGPPRFQGPGIPGANPRCFWTSSERRHGPGHGREYNRLAQSPCFKGGKFSCLSCHSLHDSDPDDLLRRTAGIIAPAPSAMNVSPNRKVSRSNNPPSDDLKRQRECYNCHMPHTTYGCDGHPEPPDQQSPGGGGTHHRPAQWMQPLPPRQDPGVDGVPPHRLVSSSGSRAVAGPANRGGRRPIGPRGDAGQRVLLAWHLGWSRPGKRPEAGGSRPFLGS